MNSHIRTFVFLAALFCIAAPAVYAQDAISIEATTTVSIDAATTTATTTLSAEGAESSTVEQLEATTTKSAPERAADLAVRVRESDMDADLQSLLSGNIGEIQWSLAEALRLEQEDSRFPFFSQLKVAAYEKFALVELYAFNYKVSTHEGEGIDPAVAVDLLSASDALLAEMKK